MEVFWNTIAHYNENTWVAQIVITFVGIILTTLLYHKPTLWVKRSVKIYMVFFVPLTLGLAVVMGSAYGLYSLRTQSALSISGSTAVSDAFPLSGIIVGAWYGVSGDDYDYHALFGCGIYHWPVIVFFEEGQSVGHLVFVSLGTYCLFQGVCLQDSGRFVAGKCDRTGYLPVL